MKTLTTCLAATVLLAGCAANDDPAAEFDHDGDRVVPGASWPEGDDLNSTRGSESTSPVPPSANENAGAAPIAAVAPHQDQPATKGAPEKPLTAADVPPPDPAKAYVPQDFQVSVFAKGLDFPTSLEADADGTLYVAEAGYSYGNPDVTPRIHRYTPAGIRSTLIEGNGLAGPINDLLLRNGLLYVSHRGKISTLDPAAERPTLTDLVTGLPSAGDHQNNQLAIGPDGKLYLGQGTATNTGVVGLDNYHMGWLKDHPDFHDIPAGRLAIDGKVFETKNPLADDDQTARTTAFKPFNEAAPDGGVIPPQTKASGTILRMELDGSDLEVYAWGLRNPYGLTFAADGRLFASENGMDARGSRPVANDRDDLYVIEEGAWYGWPDFAMGLPVTDSQFKPKGKPQPQFLMAEHPPVEVPFLTFPKHASITKLAVAPAGPFGDGTIYAAFFGHMTPMTGDAPPTHGGHRVAAIDPVTRQVTTFFTKASHAPGKSHEHGGDQNEGHGHDEQHKHADGGHSDGGESVTAGPRRLMDVHFANDGRTMYVVDFGTMVVDKDGITAVPGTGVIWKITPAE